MSFYDNIDHILDNLGDKIVRTSQGPYISVDALREYEKEVREAEQAEQSKPPFRTFAQARTWAKRDERFATPPVPRAPALASVKGVIPQGMEGETNE